MASNKLEIIYGGFFAKYRGHTVETVKRVLQHLEHKRIAKIDTAAVYAESEEFLGLAGAANHFKIDTKFCGGLSELEPTRELVVKSCHKSLSKLQTNCVR
jgi:aryl-alcohol dehydrogenase-like predicted oxidoreductase